jgi:hypothetical protein
MTYTDQANRNAQWRKLSRCGPEETGSPDVSMFIRADERYGGQIRNAWRSGGR